MNENPKYKPEPVQTEPLHSFLERIKANGKGMPQHMVVNHDGMPLYAQSIPFMLITGGTILSDPYHDRELRVVAFEDVAMATHPAKEADREDQTGNQASDGDSDQAAMPRLPTIVRVVVQGSDEEKLFLSDFN
ncbi:hypothetical protein [Aporhodopirellula aestuarii]|uniref:Uncharacterized protein n=1 Tax=Aporhodopirellula aestuarii TaxID=2950107 RepID=A0ABT0UD45_9BACT|nr:hypothetical protein [Aporhodopirellula aestuarii]MCM2374664.1 hypothetical protein [Aporhodopirellula aestuarii]